MRDIKFRAWKEENEYGLQGMFVPCLSEYNDMNDEISNLEADGIIIMQYTGLKDKNGIEIYESDIVKLNNELFIITKINTAFGLIKKTGDFYEYMCNLCDMGGRVYEVIGNIHENKDLLK